MNLNKLGMTERTVILCNPLPPTTEEELLEIAGLNEGLLQASERPVFELDWRFSGGPQREYLRVAPGKKVSLIERGAHGFLASNHEKGAIVFDHEATPEEQLRLAVAGIGSAIRFWRDRGFKGLAEYRKKHGLTAEEMEELKYDLVPYHTAAAKAKVLEGWLINVRKLHKWAEKQTKVDAANAAAAEAKQLAENARVAAEKAEADIQKAEADAAA